MTTLEKLIKGVAEHCIMESSDILTSAVVSDFVDDSLDLLQLNAKLDEDIVEGFDAEEIMMSDTIQEVADKYQKYINGRLH